MKSSILRTENTNADFLSLVLLLDAELTQRYGQKQEFYNTFNKVDSIKNVVVAYVNSVAVACGCFKIHNNFTVEIKRVFVRPENRGTGIAQQIMSELESWAAEIGFVEAILETGKAQPDAIRFYTKLNYSQTPNFGQYIGDSDSVCMAKKL